jgi:hypothetical protein
MFCDNTRVGGSLEKSYGGCVCHVAIRILHSSHLSSHRSNDNGDYSSTETVPVCCLHDVVAKLPLDIFQPWGG